jgi:hypothetical protein
MPDLTGPTERKAKEDQSLQEWSSLTPATHFLRVRISFHAPFEG